jgi:hypothetical protein
MRIAPLLRLSWLGFVVAPGCVYDSSERCSPHQVEINNDRCTCEAGYVPGDAGCVPCAENEEERSGACVCSEGYARASDDAACEPIPGGLGVECETSESCGADYPVCHLTENNGGYCTTIGCGSSDDCEAGYMCQSDGDISYCRRPPLGYGKTCDSQADCADGEATFCEVLQSNVCIVPCTAETTDVCFQGEVCCDFSLFKAGTVCTPTAACMAPGIPLGGP